MCVLIGPSGCGKTTALKMINRLIEPTDGEILIDGRSVRERNPAHLRREVGYVIQQVGLLPHLTVYANVATVPRLLRWEKERIRVRVRELLELIGLDPDEFSDRYPAQLSGGQQQRVGLARALAGDPPVMLMDEPFSAVDPITRERLQNDFLRLHRAVPKTVVFVTHDIDEAVKMGDRIALMREGHLVQYAHARRAAGEPGRRLRRRLRRRRQGAQEPLADPGRGGRADPRAAGARRASRPRRFAPASRMARSRRWRTTCWWSRTTAGRSTGCRSRASRGTWPRSRPRRPAAPSR